MVLMMARAGGWTTLMAAKNTEERVGKQLEDDKGPTKKQD
jgi:hypothetical protein